MKTVLDCLPCFVRQTVEAVRAVTAEPDVHEQVTRRVLRRIAEMNFDDCPARIGREIHRFIREATGNPDPYLGGKKRFNQFALDLLPDLEARVAGAPDPFEAAVRLAITGNIIDFGIAGEVERSRVEQSVDQALHKPIDREMVRELQRAVSTAGDILYLGDNAGEIVFDRLLVERIGGEKVTFVVNTHPVLNDATMEDARETGLADIVPVVENGSDGLGTMLDICSPTFRDRFDEAELVIAKGQANYETLSDVDKDIFFLLVAKCPVIARHIGCPVASMVIERQGVPDVFVENGRKVRAPGGH